MKSEPPPYVGPRPFEAAESGLFFGRDAEAAELRARVIAHPLVLLYAQSGAGKTSLINARLVPDLREEGFEVLPVARLQRAYGGESQRAEVENVYSSNVVQELQSSHARDAEPGAQGVPKAARTHSLSAFLKNRGRLTDELGEIKPVVLIVDQFEELFTAYPERWRDRRPFLEQMRDALADVPFLRVLLAMREDYLAHLHPHLDVFPDKARIRMRLELLREPAAVRAVEGPVGTTGKRFGEKVAGRIVSELLQVRARDELGSIVTVQGEFVEPVQLQVVCQTLWESLPDGVEVIDDDRLEAFGDLDQALGLFYDRVIGQAVREKKANELQLRNWVASKLITLGGTRGIVNEQDEDTATIPKEVIALLVTKHLVRGERRHGSHWFELAHDRFLRPIQESNLRFSQSQKTRRDAVQVPMAIGGILASVLAGYLLWIGANVWLTGFVVLAGAVYGGLAVGIAVRKMRARENPVGDWRAALLALAMLGSSAFVVAASIHTQSWWTMGTYLVLLAMYSIMDMSD